jgi:CelD/BcsL family acetyltransferase involved in cellulose biosynthesis
MEFKRYNTFEALANFNNDWNHLLENSASHVPFLRFEYLQSWWQTRGGGEWPEDSQLVIIAAFREDQLVGIAPLFQALNLDGKPALMFLGAIEVSDFLDFIVRPEDLPEFSRGLLDFLSEDKSIPSWEVLDLYNILEDSPSFNILNAEADRRGWDYKKTSLQRSPYIPLPADFESYLAGIDKKQRHEIRRKLRNIEQGPQETALYFTTDPHQLETDVETFINMMAQDPYKKDFLTKEMRQHIHNTAKAAFDQGWFQLAFLTLDGGKAAANMSFIYNNRLWLYNSGWDWDYREYSPGWVLLANLIQWAVEQGITEFDFMRGDEDYKYKFGGIDRQIYRVVLKK